MKKLIKKVYIFISRLVMSFFYKKKYLQGRHFDNEIRGWNWCWKSLFMQKIIGYNRHCPFPVSFRCEVGNWENINFDIDDLNNFQHFGCYFQSWRGHIAIGKGTYIAPNVGLITQNHDPNNLDLHLEAQSIVIGKSCWIGINAVILPGVTLGAHTIVGAGAVVTKSFPEGSCVLAGVPARIVKVLENKKCLE